jgi:hypothetical protein
MFGSLSQLFAPAAPAAPASAQPAREGQPPNSGSQTIDTAALQQQGKGGAGSATVPGEKAASGTEGAQASNTPFDEFKDFWQDPPVDASAQANQGKDLGYLGIDPTQISGAISKKDFSKVFDQPTMAKALGGDVQALGSLLNKAIQTALASSLSSMHTISERGFKNYDSKIRESLPGEFKKFSVKDSSSADLPGLQHEAVAPLFEMVQERMAAKYPNASSSELRAMSQRYMKAAATSMGAKFDDPQQGTKSPEERVAAAAQKSQDIDWEKELGF